MGCGCGGGAKGGTRVSTGGVPFTYRLHYPAAKPGMRGGTVDMYDLKRARDARDALNRERGKGKGVARLEKTDTRTGAPIAWTAEEMKVLVR